MKNIQLMITDDSSQRTVLVDAHQILPFLRGMQQYAALKEPPSLEDRLTGILLSIGIRAHIKGFVYLREGIKLAVCNAGAVNAVTKSIYPAVADAYGTTPCSVERAIRHAIDTAWRRGRIQELNELFGCRLFSQLEKPGNGELIAAIASLITRDGRY